MAKKTAPLETVSPDEKNLSDKIAKCLSSGENYKSTQGYYEEWKEYQRFWDSDQWPNIKPGTEDYPRPQTNHFGEIIEMKVAGLTYEPPEMYFEPKKGSLKKDFKIPVKPLDEEGEEFHIKPSELLTVASENVWDHNDMDQKIENFARSAGLLSNGILYSYWDSRVVGGGEGSYIGEIGVMEIDISDFFVGDPTEPDVQKQPYVIITERRPIDQVKDEYSRFGSSVDHIQPAQRRAISKVYKHEMIEQTDTEYVDLIHYWEKIEKVEEIEIEGVSVKRRSMQVNYYVTCGEFVLREEKNFYPNALYPFVNFAWYPRRKSFYGKAESRDLINNQKELNRLQGIALLGAYKTGLPNIKVKSDFVKIENLALGPGGDIIEDMSPPGTGWGVEYMQPPTIASYIPLLKDAMAQGMKDVSGVHEAWSGKAPSAHLNASAIMALQEAAGVRIRGIQRRLFAAIRDLGRIWLGYMMEHYTEDRMYKVYSPDNAEGIAWFKVDDFKKMDFEVKVAMSSASPYSKTVIASTLENMVERGIIDSDMYLKMLPPEVFPKVSDLLELVEKRQQEQQDMALQQQIQIVNEMVTKTMDIAEAKGLPITVETLEEMRQMIQETAKEQAI